MWNNLALLYLWDDQDCENKVLFKYNMVMDEGICPSSVM